MIEWHGIWAKMVMHQPEIILGRIPIQHHSSYEVAALVVSSSKCYATWANHITLSSNVGRYISIHGTHEILCVVYHISSNKQLIWTSPWLNLNSARWNLSISQDPNGLRGFGDAFQIAHLWCTSVASRTKRMGFREELPPYIPVDPWSCLKKQRTY